MIGLDTNVLTRYYIADKADAEAARQHKAARRLIESGQPLMICKTVALELEWTAVDRSGRARRLPTRTPRAEPARRDRSRDSEFLSSSPAS
jgi:predicted nucleic-acid-binding protein